ncbi:DUF3027 domain-containing protein [Acaricomes phytoseiuli]|uniref:DUF3027 domain-containing protein n=1 Tax=Acaricomes phytoseiuli TaxID=291968 RepID=UPI00036C29D5
MTSSADAEPLESPQQRSPKKPRSRKKSAPSGVPVWRVGKPDAVLAASVDAARQGIGEIVREEHIGAHLAVKSEGERVATQLFECTLPGYRGWQWFAVLARAPRAKEATVSEVGLLPSADSVLAPEWVPWSERIRPEDALPDTAADAVEEHPEPESETSETETAETQAEEN